MPMRRRASLLHARLLHGARRMALGAAVVATVAVVALRSPSAALAAGEGEGEGEEVNLVDLAAKMIADGHYDRAEQLLSEVDPEAERVDEKKLYTLQGLVYLKKQLFASSTDAFEKAVLAGQTEPVVQLYLAQGYFGSQKYEKCLAALRRAGAAAQVREGYLMRAQAHWELGQKAESFAALREGLQKLPGQPDLTRMKIFRLVELQLYQEVVDLSHGYLARPDVRADDFVAIGEALRAGRQFQQAQLLLERARLRFPASEPIALQLAHSYLDNQKPTVAAMIFEDTARQQPKYYLEAAELFKQARRTERALRNNARVPDQKAKFKQRLSLLLSQGHFEQIAAMGSVLSRLGLLADEDVRYALAFAFFNTGQFDRAENHLRSITNSRLFEASLQLRKAIETCRQAGWECQQ